MSEQPSLPSPLPQRRRSTRNFTSSSWSDPRLWSKDPFSDLTKGVPADAYYMSGPIDIPFLIFDIVDPHYRFDIESSCCVWHCTSIAYCTITKLQTNLIYLSIGRSLNHSTGQSLYQHGILFPRRRLHSDWSLSSPFAISQSSKLEHRSGFESSSNKK